MTDASSIPNPGQVYGVWNTPWKWRHISRVYADDKAGAWIMYGDDEMGGGMLPLDLWNEWVRKSGAVLIEERSDG